MILQPVQLELIHHLLCLIVILVLLAITVKQNVRSLLPVLLINIEMILEPQLILIEQHVQQGRMPLVGQVSVYHAQQVMNAQLELR